MANARPGRRLLAASIALGGVLAALASAPACNAVLGIEEQGARAVPLDANVDVEAEAGRPAFEACTSDLDCVAPNTCYTPHCDTVLGACTYALCETKDRTCAKGVCDTSTFACTDPLSYGFLATSYAVGGVTSGCGPNPDNCVAAAFPFLFLGTRDDVVALRADDLTGTEATKVPITGLTTKPLQVLASGRRLWVLGAVQGQAPPYQLSIGTIDVPSDPTVKELEAHTAVISYPFPTAVAFPAPSGGVFIAYDDLGQGFPAALVPAPPADGAKLTLASAPDGGTPDAGSGRTPDALSMYRLGAPPAGSSLVAASGTRLVLFRSPSTFNLITGAGTAAAALGGDLPLNPALVPVGAQSFAEGPDGMVMMLAPVVADPPGDCNCTSHERLQFVFPNAIATTSDVGQLLDAEGYTDLQAPAAACHVCTGGYETRGGLATWIDRRTALAAAPVGGLLGARNVTAVRALARDPIDGNAKRRFVTKVTDMPKGEFGVDRIALTSSNGIGYLVLADGQGNGVSVSIVDPRCDVAAK